MCQFDAVDNMKIIPPARLSSPLRLVMSGRRSPIGGGRRRAIDHRQVRSRRKPQHCRQNNEKLRDGFGFKKKGHLNVLLCPAKIGIRPKAPALQENNAK